MEPKSPSWIPFNFFRLSSQDQTLFSILIPFIFDWINNLSLSSQLISFLLSACNTGQHCPRGAERPKVSNEIYEQKGGSRTTIKEGRSPLLVLGQGAGSTAGGLMAIVLATLKVENSTGMIWCSSSRQTGLIVQIWKSILDLWRASEEEPVQEKGELLVPVRTLKASEEERPSSSWGGTGSCVTGGFLWGMGHSL